MHIYIDEAGPFIRPQNRGWSVSCVGALVVRDSDVDQLLADFERLKSTWGAGSTEVKGREVDEARAGAVIDLVGKFDVVFEVVAIDLVLETQEELDRHRTDQAAKITERLDDRFHPNLVRELQDLAGKLKGLPSQLYVQAICTLELLYHVLNKAKLYYVQRWPAELGAFHWFVDAKEASVTPYEDLWRTVVMPLLESKSLKRPMVAIRGADYSHFDKFCGELPEPPEHLKEGFEKVPTGPFRYFDIRKVFEQNLRFEQSHENSGIQLVDILTTSVRRGMNGNLQESGWGDVGKLMVQSMVGANTIHLIRLSRGPVKAGARPPYWEVVRRTDQLRKPMVLEGYTVEGADEG